MPFKSKAQRRKFAELLVKGEISEETFEEWNRETGGAKLPERVKPSKTRSSKPASRKRLGKGRASSKSKGKTKAVTKRPVRRKST
jgi:hypothetical protein